MSLDSLLALTAADLGPAPCLRVVSLAARQMGLSLPEPEEAAARAEALRQRGIDPGEFPLGWAVVEWPPAIGDVLVMDSHLGPSSHLAIVTDPGWALHWSTSGVVRSRCSALRKRVRNVLRQKTC